MRDDIVNVNSDVKLILIKKAVGWPLRLLDKVLSFPREPHYPQTLMLLNAYAMLHKVYELEVLEGTFTEKNGKPDGNLDRFLNVSLKILAQVSERDRYYRAWVGLFLVMAEKQVQVMTADPVELKRWIREQWDTNADVVPDDVVRRFAVDFQEIALCDYLVNLTRLDSHVEMSPGTRIRPLKRVEKSRLTFLANLARFKPARLEVKKN